MNTRAIGRRGVTLIELMVSLLITVIVGAALIRMTLAQARFMDQQEAWRGARSVARSGINRLVSDLRMVEPVGGFVAAAPGGQDFTVLVPYAFGILCRTVATVTTVHLLPVDATVFNAPGHSGFAWRSPAGDYNYVPSTVLPSVPGTPGNCTGALPSQIYLLGSINGSPAGQTANLTTGAALAPVPAVGSIIFLYRRVRYEFKNSVAVPGRLGLWRTTLTDNTTEELAAPFDNTARVNFYVLNNPTAQAAVPAPLSDIRGLELVLNGMSEGTPQGSSAPKTANVITSVFFENRPD